MLSRASGHRADVLGHAMSRCEVIERSVVSLVLFGREELDLKGSRECSGAFNADLSAPGSGY
jgi:hypothetical protein